MSASIFIGPLIPDTCDHGPPFTACIRCVDAYHGILVSNTNEGHEHTCLYSGYCISLYFIENTTADQHSLKEHSSQEA